MSASMNYRVRITKSCGDTQEYALASEEVSIGSDPGADICLLGETSLLPQHILLSPREQECWVASAEDAPLWDQNGKPVQASFMPWGTQLRLGLCRFELLAMPSREPALARGGQGDAKSNPVTLMLLLCALAFFSLQLVGDDSSSAANLPDKAPGLFENSYACPSKNPRYGAQEAEASALAKSERSVFDKQDGVSAVKLFAEAAACYRSAGERSKAQAADNHAAALRASLNQEYQLLRLRLSHATSSGDTSRAQSQVRGLLALLRHRPNDSYVLALRRLRLRLSLDQQGAH